MGSAYPLVLSENYKQAQRAFAALLELDPQQPLEQHDRRQLAAQRSLYRLSRSELGTLTRWLGWQLLTRTRARRSAGIRRLSAVNVRLEHAVEHELTQLPLAATRRDPAPMRLSA